jgi:putative hydrolase
VSSLSGVQPADALTRAIYYLDRELAPSNKVRAFQRALDVVGELDPAELARRAANGTLTELEGIGPSTAAVIAEAIADTPGGYLAKLDARSAIRVDGGTEFRQALRGDCHMHTSWSDGAVPIRAMVAAAQQLGHEYLVITDHSARLTIAHGLDEARLRRQLDEIKALNEELAPFRILSGLEVDILEDGALDLSEAMLGELDIVVASVHSKFRMPKEEMTRRMVLAIASPHVDILGHCTNRKVAGTGRAGTQFDAEIVFAACSRFGTAVEINCRPERQDPPEELLELAVEWECNIVISTDAHAPGQLEWQAFGCEKAERCGVPLESIINTWPADELVDWAASHPVS